MDQRDGRERREDAVTALDRRFSMHEVVCSERYENICKAAEATTAGLNDLKRLVLQVAAWLIATMIGIIGVLVTKVLHF